MTGQPEVFVRSDGRRLAVVPGFRERVLGARRSVTPRAEWTDDDYAYAADRKVRRFAALRAEFEARVGPLSAVRLLEVGCGDGINCLLFAHAGTRSVQGIDLAPALLEDSGRGERARHLADVALARAGFAGGHAAALETLPVQVTPMDATALDLADSAYDLVWSRSVLEHVMPVEKALAEAVRVTRPGGLLHHRIDPFFGIRGCHKRGVVDLPWAHARLDLDDFRRFVAATEGEEWAERRHYRLRTLNAVGTERWRDLVTSGAVDVLDWEGVRSDLAVAVLAEMPEVLDDLRDGLGPADLLPSELRVWLRRRPEPTGP